MQGAERPGAYIQEQRAEHEEDKGGEEAEAGADAALRLLPWPILLWRAIRHKARAATPRQCPPHPRPPRQGPPHPWPQSRPRLARPCVEPQWSSPRP